MVETIVFIATNLAAFYVMFWIVQNDKRPSIEDQIGYIRMKFTDQRKRSGQRARPASGSASSGRQNVRSK